MHATPKLVFPAGDDPHADPTDTVDMLRASDYPATTVEWLWPARIPLGTVTLLIGDPGLGKSLVVIDVAACATNPREADSCFQCSD